MHDTYGKNDSRGKLFSKLHEMTNITIPYNEVFIDYVYIDDVCEAISKAVEETRDRIGKHSYIVATGNPVTLVEAISLWCDVTGNNVSITRREQGDRTATYPISGQKVPGWIPKVSLHEGLKKIYE
jgi:nucleoside-diphosphate-sugar epimerase